MKPISSLIWSITNIYNSDWTLTSTWEIYALWLDIKFSGTNLFNEQWNLWAINNYDSETEYLRQHDSLTEAYDE